MKSIFLSLTFSLFVVPNTVNAATVNLPSSPLESGDRHTLIAGFLDDIKNEVEGVKDTIDTGNNNTQDTIDTVHGIDNSVGNSLGIIKGGNNTQESTLIQQTEINGEPSENEASEENNDSDFPF